MKVINVVIAGAAGQGVQGAAAILGKVLLRSGYYLYVNQDAQSRIRDGHNFSSIRFGDQPLGAGVKRIDFLLALNHESQVSHLDDLTSEGMAFCVDGANGDLKDARHTAIRWRPWMVSPRLKGGVEWRPERVKDAFARFR